MDSDDELEEISTKGIPGSIVLINFFDPSSNKTSRVAHEATCRMLKQCLRFSTSQLIGVCFIGIEEKDTNVSALDIKSVIDVVPLLEPNLDSYKKLKNIDFTNYIPSKEFKLSESLWHCSKMFANCKRQMSSRTVIILSKLDIAPAVMDQKPTLKRVVDLVDSNIYIQMVNISENEYVIDPFYTNFLIEANKGKDVILPKHLWNVQDIENVIYRQCNRHLALAKLSFEIGGGISIGVGVYSLLKKSGDNRLKKVDLERESNAIVTSSTKTMKVSNDNKVSTSAENEERESKQVPILKSELLYYQEYGGEKIEFTDNEMKLIKNPFGPPMMKLLGFKPADVMCMEKWFLKTGYFLFPNESVIEGSTIAFKALHQACVDLNTVAICVLSTRVNSRPNIVALVPCSFPLNLDVEVGFDVIHLPFAENMRDVPVPQDEECTEISIAHKTVMRDILKRVLFDYKADMFENPKFQSQLRAVEAIALDEEQMEPFIDTTQPDSSKFLNMNIDSFDELFGPFGAPAIKRAASSKVVESSRKRVKENTTNEMLLSRINKESVALYKVPELKEILKSKHIPDLPPLTGLKKQDLIDLVYKHFS